MPAHFILEDGLPPVAPIHHMIDRPRILDAQLPSHAPRLALPLPFSQENYTISLNEPFKANLWFDPFPYKLPGTKRIVWGVIVGQSGGLNLLFVRKPDDKHEHSLTITTENVPERVFENVDASQFFVGHEELAKIGTNLQAVAERLSSEEFVRRFFGPDDEWWKE